MFSLGTFQGKIGKCFKCEHSKLDDHQNPYCNKSQSSVASMGKCPLDYWNKEKAMPKPVVFKKGRDSPPSVWSKVKHSFEQAESFLSSASSRGLVATVSDAMGIGGDGGDRVSESVLLERKRSCFGGDGEPPCEMLKMAKVDGDNRHFCGACGCGRNKLALLDGSAGAYTKLHYPELECPLNKKGFSNEIGTKIRV